MQICPNCSFENQEGLLFCERCGSALGSLSISTQKLADAESDFAAGGRYMSEEGIIILHFLEDDDPMALQITDRTVLGRIAGDFDGESYVSLEEFGADEMGVSRQHALFRREGYELFLSDLESTNHTYLNGQRLQDGNEYAVSDGDEVTLGRLTFRVFFK